MKNNLVIHLNEDSKWQMMFANVSNFIKELKDQPFNLHIVINASAVSGVLDLNNIVLVNRFKSDQVVFKVCNNSLIGREIPKQQVDPSFVIVDTSVYEIMRLQQEEGYAYLKL